MTQNIYYNNPYTLAELETNIAAEIAVFQWREQFKSVA
jgi:hypothetical protein